MEEINFGCLVLAGKMSGYDGSSIADGTRILGQSDCVVSELLQLTHRFDTYKKPSSESPYWMPVTVR